MKEKISNILDKHNYDYSYLDFNYDINNIINQIENNLIKEPCSLEYAKNIMADLWQFQRKEKINSLKNIVLYNILKEIQKKKNYIVTDEFVVCNKFIPCIGIKDFTGFHILNNNQIQKMMSYGYGIKQFKIEISRIIGSVYCIGNHPNLNADSKEYCMDSDIYNLCLNSININLVESMLSQINMCSVFINSQERNKILEVIK